MDIRIINCKFMMALVELLDDLAPVKLKKFACGAIAI